MDSEGSSLIIWLLAFLILVMGQGQHKPIVVRQEPSVMEEVDYDPRP